MYIRQANIIFSMVLELYILTSLYNHNTNLESISVITPELIASNCNNTINSAKIIEINNSDFIPHAISKVEPDTIIPITNTVIPTAIPTFIPTVIPTFIPTVIPVVEPVVEPVVTSQTIHSDIVTAYDHANSKTIKETDTSHDKVKFSDEMPLTIYPDKQSVICFDEKFLYYFLILVYQIYLLTYISI